MNSTNIIATILSTLGLTRESLSTYKDYMLDDGSYIRLRISDHGIYLQNWFIANKRKRAESPQVPKLNVGQNLAITFAPNQEECLENNIQFPAKIKNVTKAKTESGNNVKPQFSVRHICYFSWALTEEDVSTISQSLKVCVTTGQVYNNPISDTVKYIEWNDTSNLPPKPQYQWRW